MSSSGAGGPDLTGAALGLEPAAPAAAVLNAAKDVEPSQSKDGSCLGGLQPKLSAEVLRTQATPSKGCTLHAYHGGFTFFAQKQHEKLS